MDLKVAMWIHAVPTMSSDPAGRFRTVGGCPVTVSSTTRFPEEAYISAVRSAADGDERKPRGIPAAMSPTGRKWRDCLARYFPSPNVVIEALAGVTLSHQSLRCIRRSPGFGPYGFRSSTT